MHKIISSHDNWETDLAPRIVLGLWHPTFIPHAKTVLPYLRRSYIGEDLSIARKYFWDNVEVFSMKFDVLATVNGEKYVYCVYCLDEVSVILTKSSLGLGKIARLLGRNLWCGPSMMLSI